MIRYPRPLHRPAAVLAWLGFLCVRLAADVATPVISPDGGGIAPDGLDVTVTGEAGATIYYTLDGTDPTQASAEYTAPVHLDEETGLTAPKTITFKAKAFTATEESAVASADFTNFVDPEFTVKMAVTGTEDTTVGAVTELEFGFLTGATDNYDEEYDGEPAARDDTRDQPPVPTPPEVDIRLITADSHLVTIDKRSRTQTKEWEFQAQLIPGGDGTPAEITIQWGHDAAGGFGLPPDTVPFLAIYRRTADRGDTLVGNLKEAGSLTINRADWPAEEDEYEGEDDLYRVFYIVYRNMGTLTANLTPAAANGQWYYRGLDEDAATRHGPFASGETQNVYPGDYEVSFETAARDTYYAPPNQTVAVEAEDDTTVDATFFTTDPASAELTVLDSYYDPEGGTVQVACSFSYSPDVTLESLQWVFDAAAPPVGWTLDSLEGTNADDAILAGRTITFADARAIPAGTVVEFTANFTYPDQGEDPPTVTFQATVTADFADPIVDFQDTLDGTSEPRLATLDVNADGTYDETDLVLIYFKWYGYDLYLDSLPGDPTDDDITFALSLISADPAEAQAVVDAVDAMGDQLDVNQDGVLNEADLVLVYFKWYGYDLYLASLPGDPTDDDITFALSLISADQAEAQAVVDAVDALTPAIPGR